MNTPTRATIVVGVDGSTSALHVAALWAADEAAQRHHPLRLVYANNEFAFGSTGGLHRRRAGCARRLSGRGDPRRHRGCVPTGRGTRRGRCRRLLDE